MFEVKGYEGATVTQIAREAGVTTGAIYAHYGGKAELLVDALRSHSERVTAALFPSGRPVDAATLLVTLGTRLQTRDEEETALLTEALLASRRDAELAQVLATALGEREGFMAALLDRGRAEGELTEDVSPAVAARFALMLGIGSMLVRALDMPLTDQAEWEAFIRRLVATFTQDTPDTQDTQDSQETQP